MKTSKRLLSILLMLTMLVSMFTVMASADTPEDTTNDTTVTVVVGGNGKVKVGDEKKTGTFKVSTNNVELTAVPDGENYTAAWYYGLPGTSSYHEYSAGATINTIPDMANDKDLFKLYAVFTESEEQPEPSTDVSLTVTINAKGVKNAVVQNGETPVQSGDVLKFTAKQLETAFLTATAEGKLNEAYTLEWNLNGEVVSRDGFCDLQDLKGTSNKLTVTFKEVEQVQEVNVDVTIIGGENGTVRDSNGDKVSNNSRITLKGNETETLTAYPKEGCTVSWQLGSAAAVSTDTFELKNLKADAVLKITFTETNPQPEPSGKHTLIVEANKSRRGYVKYGQREGASIDFHLETNEVVTVTAVAKSGYEFSYWTSEDIQIADRDKYDSELTIKMIDKNAKVTAVFVEKSSSSHTHKWVEKFNDTYHWNECSRCGDTTGKEKHTYIYAYDKYGYRYEKCKYCDWTSDYSYNHSSSHKDYTYEDINATYHWKTCKKCDYSVKEYHTWIKNTDRKTRDSYPYVCKYCDRLSKTDYTDLPFYDVDGNVWYYDDVLYAYINGYMDGLSAGQFAPNQNTTRAQIVTILWRLTGEPRAMKSNKFNDVPSNAYYDKAVSWAVEAGVVNGFDAKTFKPNDYVTREQLAAILYRYAEYMNLSTRGASNLMKYDDYYQIGTWARDAMAWANYHGLINGVSYSRIDPKGNATRAQVAAILHRFAVEFGNY